VPAVRGKEISRPFGEVVDEVRALADSGVSEVTLLGQTVDSYGRDLALRYRDEDSGKAVWFTGERWLQTGRRARPLFTDLLRAVGSVPGIERVRFTSPHPKDIRRETLEVMADLPTICEHLHFPLQSGSNRVLKAMHRGYTAERYMEKLSEARRIVPDLAITTDIIVGFPGETEDDFAQTLEIAAAAEYDSAYEFIFSPRPGTEAAGMTEQFVPEDVISDRFMRLRQVVEHSALQKHEAREGRIEEVLCEGPSKRDSSMYSGRTKQNKLVHFSAVETLREGSLVNVLIDHGAPHFLRGECVNLVASARHKIRIPVTASG
jgi:tRNA-2-methylthio-N6-dimethylallyladenosine synthase